MRRNLVAVGVWLAATLVAVALATAAIGTVVERSPSSEAGLAVGDPAPAPPTRDPSTTDDPLAPDPSGPRPTPTAPGGTRTYDLVGGSVAAGRSGDRVELRWATPATGFAVDVDDDDDDEVDVEFRGDAHRSRLRLWVEDGRLRAQVDEDPR